MLYSVSFLTFLTSFLEPCACAFAIFQAHLEQRNLSPRWRLNVIRLHRDCVTFVTEPSLAYLGRLMQNLTSYLRRAQLTRIFWCRLGFEAKSQTQSDTSNGIYTCILPFAQNVVLARHDSRSKFFGLLRVLFQFWTWYGCAFDVDWCVLYVIWRSDGSNM